MEHVNIISKEAITEIASEYIGVLAVVAFLFLVFTFSCLIYNSKTHRKNDNKIIKLLTWTCGLALPILIIAYMIGSFFFRVPTDRYKYEATIDKENMTITEYEEFMNAYNHSYCINGVYYFEDWYDYN